MSRITGTHGRVQAPLGALQMVWETLTTHLSREREDPGKSGGRSSGLGNGSTREMKGEQCAPLTAFETLQLPQLGPNEKQEELQQAGKGDLQGDGRAEFSQVDLCSLPPWGPSCPTQTPEERFQATESNQNSWAACGAHSLILFS